MLNQHFRTKLFFIEIKYTMTCSLMKENIDSLSRKYLSNYQNMI